MKALEIEKTRDGICLISERAPRERFRLPIGASNTSAKKFLAFGGNGV